MSNQPGVGNRPLTALLAGFAQLVHAKVIEPMRCRTRSHAGAWELARLDDRLLRDIGLTRSQVHGAAHGLIRLGKHSPADSIRPPSGPSNVVRMKRRAIASSVDGAAAPLAERAARG